MPVVCTGAEEEFVLFEKHVVDMTGQDTYWSSTTTSSCRVYCCAKRRARSLASDLSHNMCSHWKVIWLCEDVDVFLTRS